MRSPRRRLIGVIFVIFALVTLAHQRFLPGLATVISLDNRLHEAAISLQTEWLTAVMTFVTDLASGPFVTFLAAAYLVKCARSKSFARWLVFVAATAGGAMFSDAVKEWVSRQRPAVEAHVVTATNPAWPSGHSLQAVVCYGAIALLIGRRWALYAAAAMALLVGLSRIYLGVHWPSDVLGGWILGSCWLALVWTTYSLIGHRTAERVIDRPWKTETPAADASRNTA